MSQTTLAQLPMGQIGFGAMHITGSGIWGPPRSEGEAIALLRRAEEKGVTFIDTADSYGPGVSETLIAKALCPAGWWWPRRAGFCAPEPTVGSPTVDPSICAVPVRTA
jgi:aryl-alcohol dehydrogenase-like predicted oxidoreductase